MKRIQTIFAAAVLITITMQSCSKKQEGCTDIDACNFDTEAEEEDGSCTYAITWYQDLDGDGLGNPGATITSCDQPAGYIDNNGDAADLLVTATQRATVTYVGATWCPPCGAYGDPTKVYMENTHGSDVVILNVQSGDAISSSGEFGPTFGGAFQSFVSSTSIPHAYWSGANFTMVDRGFYTSASSNNSAASADINAIIGNSPKVGVTAQASLAGGTVTVHTLAKFYQVAGPHYIGVYLLEDGVMAMQQITSQPATNTEHNNVVRDAAFTGNALGVESMGTSFAVNELVEGTYTIPAGSWNSSHLEVAVVIWEANSADGISNAVKVPVP
mgnify:CR=1 FL=1